MFYKPFYRHKVLNNQGIKLVQENPNMNRNCIMSIEPVDRFNLFHSIVMSHLTYSEPVNYSTNF
jgi:hypothetical protein